MENKNKTLIGIGLMLVVGVGYLIEFLKYYGQFGISWFGTAIMVLSFGIGIGLFLSTLRE